MGGSIKPETLFKIAELQTMRLVFLIAGRVVEWSAIEGSPEGSELGSPGDARIDILTGTLWIKMSGENTDTGWVISGGAGSVAKGSPVDISPNANNLGSSSAFAGADHQHRLTATAALEGDIPVYDGAHWQAEPRVPQQFTKDDPDTLVIEQYFSSGLLIWEKRFSDTEGIVWELFSGGPDFFIDSPLRTTGVITAGDGTSGAHVQVDVEGTSTREWLSLFVGGAIQWGFRRTSASILLLTYQAGTNLVSINPNERVWNFFTGVAMAILRLSSGSNAIQQFSSVFVDASANNVTMVLPNANRRQVWRIVVEDETNTIGLNRSGGDTINGVAANLTLATPGVYFVTQNGLTDNRVHGPLAEAP